MKALNIKTTNVFLESGKHFWGRQEGSETHDPLPVHTFPIACSGAAS